MKIILATVVAVLTFAAVSSGTTVTLAPNSQITTAAGNVIRTGDESAVVQILEFQTGDENINVVGNKVTADLNASVTIYGATGDGLTTNHNSSGTTSDTQGNNNSVNNAATSSSSSNQGKVSTVSSR